MGAALGRATLVRKQGQHFNNQQELAMTDVLYFGPSQRKVGKDRADIPPSVYPLIRSLTAHASHTNTQRTISWDR